MALLQTPEMLVGKSFNLPVLKFSTVPVLFQILSPLGYKCLVCYITQQNLSLNNQKPVWGCRKECLKGCHVSSIHLFLSLHCRHIGLEDLGDLFWAFSNPGHTWSVQLCFLGVFLAWSVLRFPFSSFPVVMDVMLPSQHRHDSKYFWGMRPVLLDHTTGPSS